jgi:adenine deaminase
MKNLEELTAVASGREPADIVFHGARVLNVFTQRFENRDIAVTGRYIAATGKPGTYTGKKERDLSGKWVTPGFIDGHVHIESSMVLPGEFARTVVQHGTTTVIADSHEIANVLGPDAVRFMIHQSETAAADIYFMIPSCVPATNFEHTGGSITAADIAGLLKIPRVIGLGEMMNYPGIINNDPATIEKIRTTLKISGEGANIDGHIPLVTGKDLQAYRACSIKTDHESHTIQEVAEKISAGMWVLIRQGSSARDLELIIPELIKTDLPFDKICFCTDDKNIADIILEGHIDSNIRNAIRLGMKPELAYTAASLHTAECYKLPDTGAVCAGYKADFVILDDPEAVTVSAVYKSGEPADTGTPQVVELPQTNIGTEAEDLLYRACHSIKLDSVYPELFEQRKDRREEKYAIAIRPGSLNTEKYVLKAGEREHGLSDGTFCRLAVIERHKNTGFHAVSLLKGYGLSNGAIATSIGHDSHNIICAGITPRDMTVAVQRIKDMQGGICIVRDGTVTADLPLPVAGLMSNRSAEEVKKSHDALLPAARQLGIYAEIEPFVTLSFLALTVIPELRLTDQGLFDVVNWKFID